MAGLLIDAASRLHLRAASTVLTVASQKVFPSKIDVVTLVLYRVHRMTNTNDASANNGRCGLCLEFFRRKGTKPILQVTVT